ncbi:hypothetical protein FKM82_015934 [Ascaphus truei]
MPGGVAGPFGSERVTFANLHLNYYNSLVRGGVFLFIYFLFLSLKSLDSCFTAQPVQTSPEEPEDHETLQDSDDSSSDVLSRSLTSTIMETLNHKNVLGNLSAKGIISTADQGTLESSRNLQELTKAAESIIRPKHAQLKSFFKGLNL